MRRVINIAIFLAVTGVFGFAIIRGVAKGDKSGNGPAKTSNQQAPAETSRQRTPVRVAIVRPSPIAEYLVLPGSVEAWQDIDLGAKRGGTVEWIGPKEGDRVSSGEVILRLDVASLQARVNQAKAQLEQARKHYERTKKLVANRVSQPAELDDALAQRDVAQAVLDVAQVDLENATLRSPIDGCIDRLHVDAGEFVREGSVVAKIVQTDRVKIVVNVPEKDVRFLKVGQRAEILPGEPDGESKTEGKVYYLALTADPISRTFPMYIEVDNRQGRFRPGMIVRVRLVRRRVNDALTVPLFAVVDRGDEKVVFVEKDGKAQQRPIVPGIIKRDRVQIVRGLKENDRLIVVGQRDLVDGQEVDVKGVIDSQTIDLFRKTGLKPDY